MHRGTTPTIRFTLPFNTDTISKLFVTFYQGQIMFTKTLPDCVVEESTVIITLNQKETLMLTDTNSVSMQIRCLLKDGSALASNIVKTDVERILMDGVI